jgi:uncharacterized protein
MTAPPVGAPRLDLTLEPVSGVAVPVYAGEVLRLTQVEGGQCVQFNCFNLHDYKEYMSVGHMRREGFKTDVGQFIWSNPPRFRPMLKVLDKSPGCVTDLLVGRCSAALFEVEFGLEDHPNCQDTLADAITGYGLTPDDLHDPLNLWMNTAWDHIGAYPRWNMGQVGDHIDLLAVMDVLAVPAICGAGDLSISSNFSYKPVRVEIFEPSETSRGLAAHEWRANGGLQTQRTRDQFRQQPVKSQSELSVVPNFEPQFLQYPLEWKAVQVDFSDEEYSKLWEYRGILGSTDEEVILTLFFRWYNAYRKRPGLRRPVTATSQPGEQLR